MEPDSVVVEYAHEHLGNLRDGLPLPDCQAVQETLATLSSADVDVTKLVIIDDTAAVDGGDTALADRRTELADSYVEQLPIPPDVVVFESEFRPAFDQFVHDILPQTDQIHADMSPSVAYSDADHGVYLYVGDAPDVQRYRLTDYRPTSEKTGFTSACRCAGMTLAKLGIVDSPRRLDTFDAVVTFHRPDFYGSRPYRVAADVLSVLAEYGVITYDATAVDKRCMDPAVPVVDDRYRDTDIDEEVRQDV